LTPEKKHFFNGGGRVRGDGGGERGNGGAGVSIGGGAQEAEMFERLKRALLAAGHRQPPTGGRRDG